MVRHVGIAMNDNEGLRLKELAELIKAKIEDQHQSSLFSPKTVAKQMMQTKSLRVQRSHCVMANPDSKRGGVRLLEQDFGISLSLDKVYRMMDQWDDNAIALPVAGTRAQSFSGWPIICRP